MAMCFSPEAVHHFRTSNVLFSGRLCALAGAVVYLGSRCISLEAVVNFRRGGDIELLSYQSAVVLLSC